MPHRAGWWWAEESELVCVVRRWHFVCDGPNASGLDGAFAGPPLIADVLSGAPIGSWGRSRRCERWTRWSSRLAV